MKSLTSTIAESFSVTGLTKTSVKLVPIFLKASGETLTDSNVYHCYSVTNNSISSITWKSDDNIIVDTQLYSNRPGFRGKLTVEQVNKLGLIPIRDPDIRNIKNVAKSLRSDDDIALLLSCFDALELGAAYEVTTKEARSGKSTASFQLRDGSTCIVSLYISSNKVGVTTSAKTKQYKYEGNFETFLEIATHYFLLFMKD